VPGLLIFSEQTSERSEIPASYASRTGLAARAGRLAGPGQTASDRPGTGAQAWLRMRRRSSPQRRRWSSSCRRPRPRPSSARAAWRIVRLNGEKTRIRVYPNPTPAQTAPRLPGPASDQIAKLAQLRGDLPYLQGMPFSLQSLFAGERATHILVNSGMHGTSLCPPARCQSFHWPCSPGRGGANRED
jgi:hypothetical protein